MLPPRAAGILAAMQHKPEGTNMKLSWSALRSGSSRGVEVERELARDEVVRLPRWREGTSILVRSGVVLVTRAGDADDHVLGAGAELLLPRRGLAVAWAMKASRIEVCRGPRVPRTRAGRAVPARACTSPSRTSLAS